MSNKPKNNSLADLVWPNEAYARSTNLEMANSTFEGVADYRFTAKSQLLLEEFLDGVQGNRRDKAWSIIGPYGSGKSTFALFMAKLLSGQPNPWVDRCLVQLRLVDPVLENRVRTEIVDSSVKYLPIVVNGSRSPIDLALCRALSRSISEPLLETSWAPDQFKVDVAVTLETLEAGISNSSKVLELYDQAANLAKIAHYKGLFVIMDEFGKFLERAAWQGDLPDLITAQYLAELASGPSENQILFTVILHQGFQHYASSLSQRQWIEFGHH